MAKLVFKAESIERSRKVVDEGIYWVTLTGFAPKPAKPKDGQPSDSINFNPIMELTALADGSPAPTKDDGKAIPVFFNGNSKATWALNDFVHGFGMPMEDVGGGGIQIPGIWLPEAEQDITKCEYKGPLIGRKAQVHLIKETYNGQDQNKIKAFICSVPNCHQRFPKIKHSDSLN